MTPANNIALFAGAPMDKYMGLAEERQKMAYRPGTVKNRKSAIKGYVGFAVDMGFDYKEPSPHDLCAYIEFLVERNPAPKGIKSTFSNIKTFFKLARIDPTSVNSQLVCNALRAIDISLKHKPKQKECIHPQIIAKILRVIDARPNGPMVSFAISLMFTALLRQSNILPKSVKTFDNERQVTCDNVSLENNVLKIDLQWSKTNQRFGESTIITASHMPHSTICPVSRYIETQPPGQRNSTMPLIRFRDNNPITINFVYRYWKDALATLKIATPNMTLHRLRLSGASWASKMGVPPLAICQQGTWRTDAYRCYIVNDASVPNEVNDAMAQIRDQN